MIQFLSNKSCMSMRLTCKYMKDLLNIYAELNNQKLPINVRVLKVEIYKDLLKIDIPATVNTIILMNIERFYENYNLLSVKNLVIKSLDHSSLCSKLGLIDLSKLNIKKLYLKDFNNFNTDYIKFPINLKKLWCRDLILDYAINLDYLECNSINIPANSYIKKLKLLNETFTDYFHIEADDYNEIERYYNEMSIPICDTVIIINNSKNKIDLKFLSKEPKEIIYEN